MRLGWYVRTIGKDWYGFYYIKTVNERNVEGIVVWPDEECVEPLHMSYMQFSDLGLYNNDIIYYGEDLYKGLIKIIFSEYVTDEYFLTNIGKNIDKII